jgi:hypothetical protein
MHSMKRKFVLRLDEEVLSALEKWAADEFRSMNGQLEWVIAQALRGVGRYPKNVRPEAGDGKDEPTSENDE